MLKPLAIAIITWTAFVIPAHALSVVSVSPISDTSDVRSRTFFRATISPNDDGINDRLTIRVKAQPGRMVALLDDSGRAKAVAEVNRGGFAKLSWAPSPRTVRTSTPGTFNLRACDVSDPHACASPAINVAVRSVRIWTRTHRSVRGGEMLPIEVSTDRLVNVQWIDPATNVAAGAEISVAPTTHEIPVPDLPSGLWELRATSTDGESSSTPVVIGPDTNASAAPALIVIPTLTIRAYNYADTNRDGLPDSWYYDRTVTHVPTFGWLARGKGSEPWRRAGRLTDALAFLRSQGPVDAITDDDLAAAPPAFLDRYAAMIFPGHEEYYTQRMWNATQGFRDRGGRLWFMQANSFYTRVKERGGRIIISGFAHRTPEQSDFGIAGAGYATWLKHRPLRYSPYRITTSAIGAVPWLFSGTSLSAGDTLGYVLGEADRLDPKLSPPTATVIATGLIENTHTDIVYYTTPTGSEVINLGTVGALEQLTKSELPQSDRDSYRAALENIWKRFTRPRYMP